MFGYCLKQERRDRWFVRLLFYFGAFLLYFCTTHWNTPFTIEWLPSFSLRNALFLYFAFFVTTSTQTLSQSGFSNPQQQGDAFAFARVLSQAWTLGIGVLFAKMGIVCAVHWNAGFSLISIFFQSFTPLTLWCNRLLLFCCVIPVVDFARVLRWRLFSSPHRWRESVGRHLIDCLFSAILIVGLLLCFYYLGKQQYLLHLTEWSFSKGTWSGNEWSVLSALFAPTFFLQQGGELALLPLLFALVSANFFPFFSAFLWARGKR